MVVIILLALRPKCSTSLVGTVTFFLCPESLSRPDEESESTEWETDTDASDEEEGESEQVRGALGQQRMHALLHPCFIKIPTLNIALYRLSQRHLV